MKAPRKILAIKLRSLGDTILMTAPLIELRKAYPSAEIDVLVSEAWAPVVQGHPAVDRVLTYRRHAEMASRVKALASLAMQVRRERYDCALNFHASPSSAALAFATGAVTRSIHFHGHKQRNTYSTVVVPGKGVLKPVIERDMDVVRALGISVPEGRMPQIVPTKRELAPIRAKFETHSLERPLLALGIGSSRTTKSWPLERFADTALEWCSQTGGSAVAFAGPDELALARDFLKEVDASQDVPEHIRERVGCEMGLGLRQLAAFLSEADVFLGNDSGPKHLAVAVGTPTVTLFGPEHPFEWHPYPRERHPYFFIEELACRRDADPGMPAWCGVDVCVLERHRCMTEIKSEDVLNRCLELKERAS